LVTPGLSSKLGCSAPPTLPVDPVPLLGNLGLSQWVATGKLLADNNLLLSQLFVFMAKFLRQFETKPDSWHAAALHGHYLGQTFFITEPERRVLKEMQLFGVSQIFKTNNNMTFQRRRRSSSLSTWINTIRASATS
jgi:hypothetical protein